MTSKRTAIIFTGAVWAFGASLALGFAVSPAVQAHPHSGNAAPVATIDEDDSAWSCVDDGNRICGPGNANGAPAGCYDDGGVMVAPWPCRVVVNVDGSSDVYR